MATLDDYEAFVAIVKYGSLTKAARELGRSLQAVSRALAALEKDVGVRLVHRTTRRLQPTSVGLTFHGRLKIVLADIESARFEAAAGGAVVAGDLRLGASTLFAPTYIVPALAAFMDRHPAVNIELVLADHFQDPVGERLDLAVRIGELPDSNLAARRIGVLRRVAFAAPRYLARHGRPERPSDIKHHACVIRTVARAPLRWTFGGGPGEELVEVHARFSSTSAAACNEAVAQGLGIGTAPLWQIRGLLDTGRVELVLIDFEPEPTPVHLVWSSRKLLPARTRSLIDFLAARFPSEKLG
ncbi:MAG TPA: LysR family transcriptional regulator [Xanthobacteraceae bacterium]|jgi:DNA-binding transcriptional LysR family regulator